MTEDIPPAKTKDPGDMEKIAERLIPFAPRENTREKIKEITAEYERKLINLNALSGNLRLSCPLCEDNSNVIKTGNGRNGTKKFMCRNEHDPKDLSGRSHECDRTFRFSTYTSYEALKVYQDFLVEVLKVLTLCGGTIEGLAKLAGISRYMVELGFTALVEYLREHQGVETIEVDGDLVIIFADFSTTRVARSLSFIMARVAGVITYQVAPAINHITAWSFVKNIKRVLKCPEDATVIWVTDGEVSFVEPIQKFFPEGVHVRQFHKKSLRGLVYVHFRHDKEPYTFRCPWDLVLKDGEPSDRTRAMRRYRAESLSKEVGQKEQEVKEEAMTELYDGVILWKGIVKNARGPRRKKGKKETRRGAGATPSGAMKEDKERPEGAGSPIGSSEVSEVAGRGTQGEGGAVASDGGTPRWGGYRGAFHEVVFKGTIEEGLENEAIKYAHGMLVRVFGGLYISSNRAEILFEVKAPLKSHRTVKSGDRMILVVLYMWTTLRKRSREEINLFLREVISLERLRRLIIKRDPRKRDRMDKEKEIEALLSNAIGSGEQVIISYRDRYGNRTSRMIEPRLFTKNEYTGQTRVQAYCHLREEDRTFVLDRICDAMLDDPTIGIIT